MTTSYNRFSQNNPPFTVHFYTLHKYSNCSMSSIDFIIAVSFSKIRVPLHLINQSYFSGGSCCLHICAKATSASVIKCTYLKLFRNH